jgi:hypothetical protein
MVFAISDLLQLVVFVATRLLPNHHDKLKHIGHYSYLSAVNGSTFVARRAGIKQANSATTATIVKPGLLISVRMP